MTEQERAAYFPPVPERYPRTAYIPGETTAPADQADQSSLTASASSATDAPLAADLPAMAATRPRPPTGEAAPTAEAREQQRVQLSGRLGQNPTLRTTPTGVLVARFPLGVKDAADATTTTWHTVLAFRDRAAHVRDQLKKGDPVQVIGYRHRRELRRRDGTTRPVEEIYATAIRPR